MLHRLTRRQFLPAPIERVWPYFATPANLNEMTPPDLDFEIVAGGEPPMYEGQIIEYRVRFLPFVRSLWLTEIAHVVEGRYFVDEQRLGPYRFWYHEHIFEPVEGGVWMTDRVTYALPFGPLGDLVHALWVRRKLEHIFDFRHRKMIEIFGPEPKSDVSRLPLPDERGYRTSDSPSVLPNFEKHSIGD